MTARTLKVGLTQWHATADIAANLATSLRLIGRAAAAGAELVTLPENGLMLGTNVQMREAALHEDAAEIRQLRRAAATHGVAVVLGGMKNRTGEATYNSALVIDAAGELVGRYDKMHLFDARIGGRSFEASTVERPGAVPVLLDLNGIRIGLTICYDVRFPELSRALAVAGAQVLLVPAAFVQSTGAAHWHTLLRARAIENLAYVVAPATVHSPDPEFADAFATYGHALVVSPWGEILADLGEDPEAVRVVELDLEAVTRARAGLPVLAGRRSAGESDADPRVLRLSGRAAEVGR